MAFKGKEITNQAAKMSIKFLQTTKDTDGNLLEMQATYFPLSSKPIEHYHPHQDEDFQVISGELTVKINGNTRLLKTGDSLHIPRNTVHSMWNASLSETIVNWKVRPAMNTEYFLETVAGITTNKNKKTSPKFLQSVLLANKYSAEFRIAKPAFFLQKILFSLLTRKSEGVSNTPQKIH